MGKTMTYLVSVVLPLVIIVASVFIWGLKLEGRVDIHDTLLNEREKAIILRENNLNFRLDELRDRLNRIETKVDAVKREL